MSRHLCVHVWPDVSAGGLLGVRLCVGCDGCDVCTQVFQGGCYRDLHRMLGISSGDQVCVCVCTYKTVVVRLSVCRAPIRVHRGTQFKSALLARLVL